MIENNLTSEQPGKYQFKLIESPLMNGSFLRMLCLLLFCSAVFGSTGTDDRFTACEPAARFIEIKVTAKTIPATPSSPERRAWVLAEIPGPAQIVLVPDDPIVREATLGVFALIRDSGAEIGVDRSDAVQHQLETLLLTDLDSLRPGIEIVYPIGLLSPPVAADVGSIHSARLCLKYGPGDVPSRIEIEINTKKGEFSRLADIEAFHLADANPRFTNQPEGSIPVRLSYAQDDLNDARKDSAIGTDVAARTQVERDLLAVANAVFEAAIKHQLVKPDGTPLVGVDAGQNVATNVENEIASLYNLNGLDPKVQWAKVVPRAKVKTSGTDSVWVISVDALELAQQVDIEVEKSPIEMDFDNTTSEIKFDAKRRKVHDLLLLKHSPNFRSKPGHIITSLDISHDKDLLRADKQNVQSVGDITSGPANTSAVQQRLLFTVSRHLKAEKVGSLKLGVGYSPEEHLTGSVGVDETNLLGISELIKLAYSGGPQTQRIQFNFDRPFANTETFGWHVKTLGVNVQYFSDNDKRFANLTLDEISMRETGSSAQMSIAYDSFSLSDHATADCLEANSRKRTRINFVATPALSFRDVNIKEDDRLLTITKLEKVLLPSARTQTTTFSVETSAGVRHDFREFNKPGAGILTASINGRWQRGFRLFGADYDYEKISATLSVDFLFGVKSTQDFLLRYNRVMSTAKRGTPIFELQRLGGPQTVRGLEEGEAIGRKLSADQVEFGINALVIWNWISRKPVAETLLKTDCSDEDEGAMKPPFDLRKAYVKFFYDRGRIHDSDSFLVPGRMNRVAQGYGVAIELRQLGGQNVNLSIGYAYSPESALHRSGTVYTGVSYSY